MSLLSNGLGEKELINIASDGDESLGKNDVSLTLSPYYSEG